MVTGAAAGIGAACAIRLATDYAGFGTGQVIPVNGGRII